ncbi:hypothetical protein HK107_01040 [Parvularcula sp. ZS-1/3]|uniref:Peptidase M12A domain-containing protein n=1 Tax=Parvularcula mediterranea TaxID=2732508 RepID=A0A7Y3RJY4_9PROT|nr:M12 family metallopeptidase [Parvularcula mediterranea]NNU14906.1 hypothetical protein [Parvularcula mediterranea]
MRNRLGKGALTALLVFGFSAEAALAQKKTEKKQELQRTTKPLTRKKTFPPLIPSQKIQPKLKLETKMIMLPWRNSPWEVTYDTSAGFPLWEGDIDLTNEVEAFKPTSSAITVNRDGRDVSFTQAPLLVKTDQGSLWPANRVPWELDSTIAASSVAATRIAAAIAMLEADSHLTFVPYDEDIHSARITFAADPGLGFSGGSSPVGRQAGIFGDGQNRIRLNGNVGAGLIAHEILHSLGFYHEQARADRDRFITIDRDKIQDGRGHNFDRHVTDVRTLMPYDCASIMHYGANAFLKPGETGPVISSRDETICASSTFGTRTALSDRDKEGLKRAYPPVDCATTPVMWSGAYRGRTLSIDGDYRDLGMFGWGDDGGSICVPNGWIVILYEDPDYRGGSLRLGPGRHLFSRENRIASNSTHSIRALSVDANPVPDACRSEADGMVMMYEHDNLRGRRAVYTASDRDIGDGEFSLGDRVSSLCVPPNWRVTFFNDPDMRGDSFVVDAGSAGAVIRDIKNATGLGNHFDDALHSVRIRRPATSGTVRATRPG